jgi:hypothetical protein
LFLLPSEPLLLHVFLNRQRPTAYSGARFRAFEKRALRGFEWAIPECQSGGSACEY